ncbi:NAC domain-containing protein 83-like [Salvia divinorum]|uniref:NAC domain-containing protein 83-like n=1 Tax=Salvia divinorum TaxID=28513 RepID=A0ABD1HC28_SALDI
MDKLNFVRDGGRKLPPGFRFEPTDEEIVFQYLSRKTFSHPLPALVIPVIDVFSLDPWHLAGDSEEGMYFFSNINGCEDESERVTPSGFWKANASSKQINSSRRMPIVGIKKSLVFYMRSSTKNVATHWIMHQYCIVLSQREQNNCLVRIGEWSLCRIFMKKGGRKTQVEDDDDDDDDADSYSASSSSRNYDSTIFTEVSSST